MKEDHRGHDEEILPETCVFKRVSYKCHLRNILIQDLVTYESRCRCRRKIFQKRTVFVFTESGSLDQVMQRACI